MVRSTFIVVSEDQLLVQKAYQFGMMNNCEVKVMTPSEYEASQKGTAVPSLVAGAAWQEGLAPAQGLGKVLPFPGTPGYGTEAHRLGGASGVSTIDQLESVAIENAISAFKGNLTEAAKALGIGRATLYRKVKAYNLDPSQARKKKAA